MQCLIAAGEQSKVPWMGVANALRDEDANFYEALHAASQIAKMRPDAPPPADLFDAEARSTRGDEPIAIASDLVASVRNGEPPQLATSLAKQQPPSQYANFAVGLYWLQTDNLTQAAPALQAEGQLPHAHYARELLVSQLALADWRDSLDKLREDPNYAPLIPNSSGATRAAEQGDWLTVFRHCIYALVDHRETGPVILALFTGVCWLAFVLHAGRSLRGGVRWPLCVAGVLLGMASIPLTLFFIYVQEIGWGLEESNELSAGVIYYVLGVGFREELAKLILFLPLVPVIVRGNSELEALLVAACVGLGFAVEENINYFSGGSGAVGRLTTANFLHMSLTGLVGLAVCRAVWHPKTLGPEALGVFGVAVFAHGAYDSFLAIPALSEGYGMLALILYVLIVYRFFHEFNATRPAGVDKLNLSFTFTVGVALVASAAFVHLSWLTDQRTALQLLSGELIASAATIYLFLREAPDSLIDR